MYNSVEPTKTVEISSVRYWSEIECQWNWSTCSSETTFLLVLKRYLKDESTDYNWLTSLSLPVYEFENLQKEIVTQ